MRAHYWQYVLNTEGQPVSGATIILYTDSTLTTPVTVYTTDTGSSVVTAVTSNNKGYFEFWVGDPTETFGYNTNQGFSLVIFSNSVAAQQIDNLQLRFSPPRLYSSDLTGSWISAGGWGSVYMYNVVHNLNTPYPVVQLWNGNKLLNDNSILCYTAGTNSINLSAAGDPGGNLHIVIIGSDV